MSWENINHLILTESKLCDETWLCELYAWFLLYITIILFKTHWKVSALSEVLRKSEWRPGGKKSLYFNLHGKDVPFNETFEPLLWLEALPPCESMSSWWGAEKLWDWDDWSGKLLDSSVIFSGIQVCFVKRLLIKKRSSDLISSTCKRNN